MGEYLAKENEEEEASRAPVLNREEIPRQKKILG